MNNRKKIFVFGATGAQGGSVARNLLSRSRFDVRTFTRKADSQRHRGVLWPQPQHSILSGEYSFIPSVSRGTWVGGGTMHVPHASYRPTAQVPRLTLGMTNG